MGQSKRRWYTDKERADTVATLIGLGYPHKEGAIIAAHNLTGVPISTLHGWANGNRRLVPDDVLEESKKELADLISEELDGIFEHMKIVRAEASYRDLGVVAGILFDKKQLLNGLPTGNVKQTIAFERTGITTLPEHLTPRTIEGTSGEETV